MAKRRVTWTKRALEERRRILEYWRSRNKSKEYSIKLFNLFNSEISQLVDQPEIGIEYSKTKSIKFLIVKYYRIYYAFSESEISVLSIWDQRRNASGFKL